VTKIAMFALRIVRFP